MSKYSQEINHALVLAAGNGSRLKNHRSKPLLKVLGVPLLARTLFTLEQAGITDAYVVIGYEADHVRHEIEGIERLKIRIHWLYNDDWKEPNGLSVLAAESVLTEPFILTMCDHLFDPATVTQLMRNVDRLQGVDLAVDRCVDDMMAWDDATKVKTSCERIVSIGKTLGDYDAIDTGVFLASPRLFGALREARAEGNGTLSHGVQKLAERGEARLTDVSGRMWHDIDTLEDVVNAERKLLASVRKDTDGPIARYINRPISTAISRHVVKTPITAIQVSMSALVISLVSAALAAVGGYIPWLMSGLLFQAASVLDGTDGEVAKLTFTASLRGEWIDTVSDNVSYLAFLLGLIIGVYRSPLPDSYYLLGILGLVSTFVSVMNLSFYLMRKKKSGSFLAVQYGFETGNSLFVRVMRVVKYFGKRDFLAFLAMVVAIGGKLPLALPLFGIGATLLLLPATLKVNLESLRRARKPPLTARPVSVLLTQDPEWFGKEEPEPVRSASA